MKILITGSNGLLGQKLVELLAKNGEQVIATARGASRIESSGFAFEYCEMDISDEGQVDQVVGKYQPEVVIHTAAMTNVDQCEQDQAGCQLLNVTSVGHLITACERHGCFLVHLSTDFIFDGEAGPYREEDTPNPLSFYGQSKLDAENLVKKASCPWAILRTVLVYGITPGMSRSNIILWVKNNLEQGKPLNLVSDQWRTPTLAEDLAIGCHLVAQQKATGVFNISGKEMLTPYDMAIKTAEYFKLDASLITEVDASTFSQPARRPPKTGFVLDKAREVLGYDPRSFEEGIRIVDEQVKQAQQ